MHKFLASLTEQMNQVREELGPQQKPQVWPPEMPAVIEAEYCVHFPNGEKTAAEIAASVPEEERRFVRKLPDWRGL